MALTLLKGIQMFSPEIALLIFIRFYLDIFETAIYKLCAILNMNYPGSIPFVMSTTIFLYCLLAHIIRFIIVRWNILLDYNFDLISTIRSFVIVVAYIIFLISTINSNKIISYSGIVFLSIGIISSSIIAFSFIELIISFIALFKSKES